MLASEHTVDSFALPTASRSADPVMIGKAAPIAFRKDEGTVDALNRYRMALALQARRFKRYPVQARSAGLSGRVEVKLAVGENGKPQSITVSRSSDQATLDGAALAMIEAGAAQVQVPSGLLGQAFAVVLPVVFDLSDE